MLYSISCDNEEVEKRLKKIFVVAVVVVVVVKVSWHYF